MILTFNFAANATDQELASKLKEDLEFDTQRRNDFKNQSKNTKVYEKEREKGLSLFLEEQERWDVTREKGINEQRALRLREKKMDENGPEYRQDFQLKQKQEQALEAARRRHVQTKKQISEVYKNKVLVTEEEELEIYNERPRYELRLRAQNKWVGRGNKGSSAGTGSFGGSSGGGYSPPPPSSNFDYPPPPSSDYVPMDNFEEIPPPPPLPYDSYGNPTPDGNYFNNGNAPEFGAPQQNMGYPPPPPDGGWEF